MAKEDAARWLSHPGMPEELLNMMKEMSEEELGDSFYRDLAFGTGGLRGVLGPGTNRMNVYTVARATRGLGHYILAASDTPSCAVSCDSRIHSRDFAELTAAVLAGMGIRVYLYEHLMPTPMLSYAVRHLHCTAGVMITASHNPAKFNGYKVYGSDGCQITLEAAEKILGLIDQEETLVDTLPDFGEALASGKVTYIDQETIETYYACIDKLRITRTTEKLHVVYSPLNGTGNVPVREMLRRLGNIEVSVVPEQEMPDGHFPTAPYPNPEIREAMQLAIRQTVKEKADLCFATDPDCDRIGAGVRRGDEVTLISGNDMGILLLDYVCSHRKNEGGKAPVAVKTIVTTEMAVPVCKKYGVELRNVLTGFKFIGEQIGLLEEKGKESSYIFGFEESYGYLSGSYVRDKDAVDGAFMICEMFAWYQTRGISLLDRLEELYSQYGYCLNTLHSYEFEGSAGFRKMQEIMQEFHKGLDEIGPKKVVRTLDYSQGLDGLPKSDVLKFYLEDNCSVVVRPSGTEPKLKTYLSVSAENREKAEAVEGQISAVLKEYFR